MIPDLEPLEDPVDPLDEVVFRSSCLQGSQKLLLTNETLKA